LRHYSQVSATRSSLAAALAVSEEREVESADAADEATAMVRDLRAELEAGPHALSLSLLLLLLLLLIVYSFSSSS
jgi:hypothetical protein